MSGWPYAQAVYNIPFHFVKGVNINDHRKVDYGSNVVQGVSGKSDNDDNDKGFDDDNDSC